MRGRGCLLALCAAVAPAGCLIDRVTWSPLEERGCEPDTCAYVKASNTGVGDKLGSSVALSRDGLVLAVGAPFEDSAATGIDNSEQAGDDSAPDAGAVYVYRRVDGAWSLSAYLKASDTDAGDRFGHSVALSPDGLTLAVGAPFAGTGSTGVAYVFTFDGTAWRQQDTRDGFNPPSGTGDQFGSSVALSENGSKLAVGAIAQGDAGAVYVFVRNDSTGTWIQQAGEAVRASNAGPGDLFGSSVALSADGRTLAVGAPAEDSAATGVNGTQSNEDAKEAGAVYVFIATDPAGPPWTQQAYVKASNTDLDGDRFGISIALSGDGSTLAVGATNEDSDATGVAGDQLNDRFESAGAVYVFARTTTPKPWQQEAYVKASNTGAQDQFGHGVALSTDGSILVVGAVGEASAAKGVGGDQANEDQPGAGAVYRLERDNGRWSQQAYVKSPNTDANDLFGSCVAVSGDGSILAAGAPGESSNTTGVDGNHGNDGALASGAAYVFALP